MAVTMPTARSRAVSELDFVPGTYPPLMRVEEGCLGKESNNLTCVMRCSGSLSVSLLSADPLLFFFHLKGNVRRASRGNRSYEYPLTSVRILARYNFAKQNKT